MSAEGAPRTLLVSPQYLQAVGARLSAGRWMTFDDASRKPPVMLINRELQRRFFPNVNPVGKFVNAGRN